MSSARASKMSGSAGNQSISWLVSQGRTRGAGHAISAWPVTDAASREIRVLAIQNLGVPRLGNDIGVNLRPVLNLLDILIVRIRQPLGFGRIGQLEITQNVTDRASTELGKCALCFIGEDEVEQQLCQVAFRGVVFVD